MTVFLQQLVNGLIIGSSYALVAVGFTLIFGVLRIVYLAHGAVLVWLKKQCGHSTEARMVRPAVPNGPRWKKA